VVAAYHLIWTIYGVWLPNDPRGSHSTEVRADWLQDLGEIHLGRKKIQPSGAVLRKFFTEAKPKLKHDVLPFNESELALIAATFANVIQSRRYICYGCAIMPDHVHLLIRKHRDQAEEMVGYFQDDSWKGLMDAQLRPSDHPIWVGPGWKVFLNSRADIERTVRYIELNPLKANLPAQAYDFVQPYDGWLPGIGSPKK
jgi:REP element-mobilizing transposase RayT